MLKFNGGHLALAVTDLYSLNSEIKTYKWLELLESTKVLKKINKTIENGGKNLILATKYFISLLEIPDRFASINQKAQRFKQKNSEHQKSRNY